MSPGLLPPSVRVFSERPLLGTAIQHWSEVLIKNTGYEPFHIRCTQKNPGIPGQKKEI
jgi:hypothetical protein